MSGYTKTMTIGPAFIGRALARLTMRLFHPAIRHEHVSLDTAIHAAHNGCLGWGPEAYGDGEPAATQEAAAYLRAEAVHQRNLKKAAEFKRAYPGYEIGHVPLYAQDKAEPVARVFSDRILWVYESDDQE